jgi:hypothetical protein
LGFLFERLPVNNRKWFFFAIGFLYAFVGVVVSFFIFSKNIGLVSVFLISIGLASSVNSIFSRTALLSGREVRNTFERVISSTISLRPQKLSLRRLYLDNESLFWAYFSSFFGVFFFFSIVSLVLPPGLVSELFGSQLSVLASRGSVTGGAIDFGFVMGVLLNNTWVLFVVFALSFLFEYGMTFVIVWNASVWGAVFANFAQSVSRVGGVQDPFSVFALLMVVVLPHVIIEAGSYFLGAISGGLLNKTVSRGEFGTRRFSEIFEYAVIFFAFAVFLLVLGAFVEMVAGAYLSSFFSWV